MKRKIFSIVLSLCMILAMMPAQAFAAGTTTSGKIVVSDKVYEIAPDITERAYTTNDSNLSAQQMGHVLEVKLGENAKIVAGYNDYNIEAIKSGENWGMRKTTEQAQAAETRTGMNVVGAVNGDFFDMSNGRPTGTLVMDGTVVQTSSSPCFYVDADGNPHITPNSSNLPEGVKEAVSGWQILVQNGKALTFNDTTTNPRTAVGIRADNTVVFYMVDGRQAPLSVGMTSDEVAQTMADLGCVIAMNLDGGGSSTFATQRAGESNEGGTAGLTLRCSPSDGYERNVSSSILVVSTAKPTGQFDHAILAPSQEVYTPGSSITFTASGVDASGASADLPESGLEWTILEGSNLGSIDNTGVFTGNENAVGTVEVGVKYEGNVVGTATIELQWPDKLDFTNSSVSLDFGENSDLTFSPTYQGRTVNYKDGDFKWTLDAEYYKGVVNVEQYYHPAYAASIVNRWLQLQVPVTGAIGEEKTVKVSSSDTLDLYETVYVESQNKITYGEDGKVSVEGVLTHKGAIARAHTKKTIDGVQYNTGDIIYSNLTADVDDGYVKVKGLEPTKEYKVALGQFDNNTFTADADNSLRGTINVELAKGSGISASVSVVVGMEPYMLMDFEDHFDTEKNRVVDAKEYWKFKVGASEAGNNFGNLTAEEVAQYKLWVRMASNAGVTWPKDENGNEINAVVSSEEDENVRFGENALKLAWDFTKVDVTKVAASEFGFSGDLWVDNIKPTKIGMWINVPKSCECTDSFLNIVLKGNAVASGMATAYFKIDENGDYRVAETGKQLNGTTSYVRYRSYDSEGNETGSTLGDWAGKGWVWVEADISAFQMPIDICRGYTVRVVSPQNSKKATGTMYIDNLQFIYGTNTNDINNPVIESISEKSTGIDLKTAGERPIFTSKTVTFEVPLTDNKQTDKYATGIDSNSIKVYVDGRDYTSAKDTATGNDLFTMSETVYGTNIVFQTPELTNGQHSIKIRVKDFYGNETVETYSYIIDDEAGKPAAVTMQGNGENATPGGEIKLEIINNGESAASTVEATVEVAESYAKAFSNDISQALVYGESYEMAKAPVVSGGKISVFVQKKVGAEGAEGNKDKKVIATLKFAVPETVKKGDAFTFAVPEASYSNGVEVATFSLAEQSISYTAAYEIAAGQAIVNKSVDFTVTDSEGVKKEDVKLYDESGRELTSTVFTTAGRKTVYAKDADGKRSWNLEFIVCGNGTDGDGYPYGIQNNAAENGATAENITWLSAIESSKEEAYIKYAKTENELASAQAKSGTSEYITFEETSTGEAFRLNSVKLEGLTPNTTYYYQVGDGEKWSDVLTFATSAESKKEDTNFFIFGDIQSNNTSKVSTAINKITSSSVKYDFGIQTGDAIDDVTKFANWRSFLTTINSEKLKGIDVFHTLGNHEYYGDADGSVAGSIFGLPEREAGSFYSSEYGSVYVAVINNGGNLVQTIGEVQNDAQSSTCAWKVLVIHEPIYGTESEMDAETRAEIVSMIGEADIDFVFTGDDHAYARTYPMVNDVAQAENSRRGTVFYVCGDLSDKSNTFVEQDYFAKAIPHTEYQGMYMTANATNESITIAAYDYNGNLLDSYTETRTNCEIGNHTFSETSKYDLANKTLTCKLCGKAGDAADSGYSGKLATTNGEGEVFLLSGVVKTGWFALGEDICHAADNGLIHKSETRDTATCLNNGNIKSFCECGKTYVGNATWAKGHDWDDAHICKTCGTAGINMEDVTLTLPGSSWTYRGGAAIKPGLTVTYGDYTLNVRSDRYGTDGYKSYHNNINPGYGTITVEGRGNFYGSKSIDFIILPAQVTNLKAKMVQPVAATIQWDAAGGAKYYKIYQKTGNSSWKLIDTTTATEYSIIGLEPGTSYSYRIKGSVYESGQSFDSFNYSDVLAIETPVSDGTKTVDLVKSLSVKLTAGEGEASASATLPMTAIDGEYYLLLPSYADLANLELAAEINTDDTISCIGKGGMQTISSTGGTIDVDVLMGGESGTENDIMIAAGNAEPMTIHILKSTATSAMYLTSDDPINQGRGFVDASKQNKTTAQMTMVKADGTVVYNGGLKQLKARGNSTFAYYDKKPYQIKLNTGTDLLGTGENVKTWVLLAGYADATQMRDKLFKDLAAEMGMPYTASCDWVDLYYDGEYRGTYLLTEKNSVDSTSVNIRDLEKAYEELNPTYGDDAQVAEGTNAYGQQFKYTAGLTEPENITGGYLIERNLKTIDEASGFYTKQDCGFNVKSPEYAGEVAMKYISEYYQEFEDAVFAQDEEGNYTGYNAETGKYYYEYCDLDSLVKVFLIQELSLNCDGFMKSFYFYKDMDGIMYAGPVWDMDMSCGSSWSRINSPESNGYYYLATALRKIPGFMEAVDQYYDSTFENLAKSLVAEGGAIDTYADRLGAGMKMNSLLWPYVRMGSPAEADHLWAAGTTYDDVVSELENWLARRLVKLNSLYGDGTMHTEHMYGSKVTKEPTYTEEGERTYTCKVCGHSYTESIPKLTAPSGGEGSGGAGGGGYIPSIPSIPSIPGAAGTEDYKQAAIDGLTNAAEAELYDAEEQAAIDKILEDAKAAIEAAESEEEVAAIEKEALAAIDAIDTSDEKLAIDEIQSISNNIFKAKSKIIILNKKKAVKITWNTPDDMDFNGYEIYRSTKKNSGYGKKPIFTTTKNSYINTKNLKEGNTYYYKVRAFKYVNGRKIYTQWSTKAWRTIK